jgi:hypothetical protein
MSCAQIANVIAIDARHLLSHKSRLVLACFCAALDNAHLKRGAYARRWLKAQTQFIHSNKSEGAACLIFCKILQRRSTPLHSLLRVRNQAGASRLPV